MRIRVCEINSDNKTTYAILYEDGTMLLSTDCKNLDEWCGGPLWDVFTHSQETELLSATLYGGRQRWDEGGILYMSLWNAENTRNLAMVGDDSRLQVYDVTLARKAKDSPHPERVFSAIFRPSTELKSKICMRLVSTGNNLDEGLYLLYPNGTMNSSLHLNIRFPKDCQKVLGIIRSPAKAIFGTSDTGERWDRVPESNRPILSDVESWGADIGRTVLAIDTEARLFVVDPTLMHTLDVGAASPLPQLSLDEEGPRITKITLKAYSYILILSGLVDDYFYRVNLDPDTVRNYVLGWPIENRSLEQKMKTRVKALQSTIGTNMRRTRTDAPSEEAKEWFGFPFVLSEPDVDGRKAGNEGRKFPVFYPGDDEYERNQGNMKDPCLPMYPRFMQNQSSYIPVPFTFELRRWYRENKQYL